MKKRLINTFTSVLLIMIMLTIPVCAASGDDYGVSPCFNATIQASLTIGFDMNNVVYCGLSVVTYDHGAGVSGLMKLFDSDGTMVAIWPVSDYDEPFECEFTYQGEYGETYTATFAGYTYTNNMTQPDRLELSVTDTCVD